MTKIIFYLGIHLVWFLCICPHQTSLYVYVLKQSEIRMSQVPFEYSVVMKIHATRSTYITLLIPVEKRDNKNNSYHQWLQIETSMINQRKKIILTSINTDNKPFQIQAK